jgi:hypothetical protein
MSTYRTIVQMEESSNYLASQAALQVTITVTFRQLGMAQSTSGDNLLLM